MNPRFIMFGGGGGIMNPGFIIQMMIVTRKVECGGRGTAEPGFIILGRNGTVRARSRVMNPGFIIFHTNPRFMIPEVMNSGLIIWTSIIMNPGFIISPTNPGVHDPQNNDRPCSAGPSYEK